MNTVDRKRDDGTFLMSCSYKLNTGISDISLIACAVSSSSYSAIVSMPISLM